MQSLRAGAVLFGVVLASAGCRFDLDVPAAPQRGGLTGRVDAGGRIPLTGQELRLTRGDTGARRSVTLDEQGAFLADELTPGPWLLAIDLPGFAPLREGPYQVVTGAPVDLGVLTPTWLGQTPAEALVHGRVVATGTGATSDAGAHPSDVQGATVSFLLEGAQRALAGETTVSAEGTFSLRVPPGVYTVQVKHPYFVAGQREGLAIQPGEQRDLSAEPIVLDINPAEIAGRVRLEVDKQDTTSPAVGVIVTSDTGLGTVTDQAGLFRLGSLPAGTRTLTFTTAGYRDAAGSHVVRVGAAELFDLGVVTLRLERGDLTGEVEMADGAPLQSVVADVVGRPYAVPVVASSTQPSRGRFVIAGVPVGTHTVRASRPNYIAAQSAAVTVAAGGVLDVGLLRLTRLQGDFLVDDGDPTNTPGFTRTRAVTLLLSNVGAAASYRVAEGSAANLAAEAWQPFASTSVPFTLSSGDELKTVFLQFRDAANNESAPLSASVVLDGTPPASPSIEVAGGAGYTRLANPLPVTVSASDPGSGVALVRLAESPSLDGGVLPVLAVPWQREMSFTRGSSADGPQSVSAQFVDHAGNVSAVVTDSVVVDTVAPTGTLALARGPRATVDGYTDELLAEVRVTPSAAEPWGGPLYVRLGNAITDLPNAPLQLFSARLAWFLDPAGQGDKTVHAQLVDGAGNESAPMLATLRYDTVAPSLAATRTTPGLTNQLSVGLSLAATDTSPLSPTQGLTLSESVLFSGATPTIFPITGVASFTLAAGDGPRTVFARVRDAAGNDAVASVSLTLDQSPPTFSGLELRGRLGDGSVSTTLSQTSTVDVGLEHAGATRAVVLNGAGACPSLPYPALSGQVVPGHVLAGVGSRTVTACVADEAGNVAGPRTASIVVDGAAPAGCQLRLEGYRAGAAPLVATTSPLQDFTAHRDVGAFLAGCDLAPVAVAFTEATSVTCSPSSALEWRPASAALSLTLSAGDGPKTVRGCVRDDAWNVSSFVADDITLDTTPPSAASLVLDDGASFVNAALVGTRGFSTSARGTANGATQWALHLTSAPPEAAFHAFTGAAELFAVSPATDGLKRVYAVFRDDLGHRTEAVFDEVTFDTAAPVGGTLTVSGNLVSGTTWVRSPVVTVTFGGLPADATQYQLAEVASCTAASLAAVAPRPLATTVTFTMSPGEGTKTLCARTLDAAGNPGAPFTHAGALALDTLPPSRPQLLTPSPQVLPDASGTSFVVTMATPPADATFDHFEVLGGTTTAWTTQAPAANAFTFTLLRNTSLEAGVSNFLRVRAVDRAGNASADDGVSITLDSRAPQPPVINRRWVDNGRGGATVYWQASASPDVKGYLLYYSGVARAGQALSSYNGTGADQGDSPLFIPASAALTTLRATLSGVANGSPLYVTVVAVDRADQASTAPVSPAEVVLEPNLVSPSQVATVTLPNQVPQQLLVQDHRAYVLSIDQQGCGATRGVTLPGYLSVVDLASLRSPIQGGLIQPTVPAPSVTTQALTGLVCAGGYAPSLPSMLLDGHWLFVMTGPLLRIFSLANPAVPALVGSPIDLSLSLSTGVGGPKGSVGLYQVGDVLFVAGDAMPVSGYTDVARVAALDLSTLYDGNASTFPSAASVLGTAQVGIGSTMARPIATRNRLVTPLYNGASGSTFSLDAALDDNAGTTFNDGARLDPAPTSLGDYLSTARSLVSGNLVLAPMSSLRVYDVGSLWGSTFAFGSTLLSSTIGLRAGALALAGSHLFASDVNASGLRSLELGLTTPAAVGRFEMTGFTSMANHPYALATYGNYLLAGLVAELAIFEAATPRSPAEVSSIAGMGPLADVADGFLYAGDRTGDLFSGVTPTMLNLAPVDSEECVYETTRLGDVLVSAAGHELLIADVEAQVDRNAASVWSAGSNRVSLLAAPNPAGNPPAGTMAPTHVTSVRAWGSYLVVAEFRGGSASSGAGGSELWLEVLDARRLKDRKATPPYDWSAQRVAEVRLASYPAPRSRRITATLRIVDGRAFVGVQEPGQPFVSGTPSQPAVPAGLPFGSAGFLVADLRPVVDDVAGGSITPLGAIARDGIVDLAVSGSTAWLSANGSLWRLDVGPAMQEPAASLPPAATAVQWTGLQGVGAVDVFGGYALVTSNWFGASGLYSLDVSGATPSILGFAPGSLPSSGCQVSSNILHNQRAFVTARGTRAYLSSYDMTRIYELE